MTSSKKSHKLKKAEALAILNGKVKPDFDAPSPPSSVVPGPDTHLILATQNLTKAHLNKLEGKTAKLITKRKQLEDAVDAERALLSGGRPAAAVSPVWSGNMEALQGRIERLSAKEMSHMTDLTTKLGLVEEALAQKESSKKRKAVEAVRQIRDRFHDHLRPYIIDYATSLKEETFGDHIKKEASDEDEMDVESLEGDKKNAEKTEMTLQEEFEKATRNMNLDEYDPTEIPSDVEDAVRKSAAKSGMTGGFTPINSNFHPYLCHSVANHGFNFGLDDDPFFDEEEPDQSKAKNKKDKKRKRESLAENTAEVSNDEHETPKKKSKKSKKRKGEAKQDDEDVKHEASPRDSPKKSKKAKKNRKDRDASPVVWNGPRRYSTSVIPLPVIPVQSFSVYPMTSHIAQVSPPTLRHIASPTGPPVPIAAPVAPNSGRRRSFGAFSFPKQRIFSSIRNSPPPVIGDSVTTPEKPTKQWILEGGASRGRAKSTSGKVTMTIGDHPPVQTAREASPAEAASQKRRKPGRPKGSKTESRKAVIAGSPPFISTTPIPLPAYASRSHNEDLVLMVLPDAEGRPVFASSPARGSMTLEDRRQHDLAMFAEEKARWFQLLDLPAPEARGNSRYM